MMLLPPLASGGVNDTVMRPLPAVAFTLVGASGVVSGVALLDAADAAPVPTILVALTVQVTGALASPDTTMGEAAPLLLLAPQVAV